VPYGDRESSRLLYLSKLELFAVKRKVALPRKNQVLVFIVCTTDDEYKSSFTNLNCITGVFILSDAKLSTWRSKITIKIS
jgi:hypothetical protein